MSDIRDKLCEFLFENDCMTDFAAAFATDKDYATLDDLCEFNHPNDLIEEAFLWPHTDYGSKYWSDINDMWVEYITGEL